MLVPVLVGWKYCLQMSNSMEWAQTHIEAIKDNCKRHVEFNQPIPQDVLDNIQIPANNSSDDDNSSTTSPVPISTTTTAAPTNVFSPQLLNNIREMSCPNDCSKKGTCTNGKSCKQSRIGWY